MIVGLTGRNASGKGVAAAFFQSVGFIYFSLSDELRSVLQEKNIPITRENLIEYGRQFRHELGPAFLAHRIYRRLDPEKNYVIDSIRHPEEIRTFRLRNDFRLLLVKANPKIRFERICARQRENDPLDWDTFLAVEARELKNDDPMGQQIEACETMADVVIENESTIEAFHEKLRRWLRAELEQQPRLAWDHYFMRIAKVTALRSNCLKRKVAAVVVKDRRIISTGYNGTPRGVKNCHEGGCPRCYALGASGQDLERCYCSHAEENAITQAAYHGISLHGAILYCTLSPCILCTKMIINAGIREVVYEGQYPMEDVATQLLQEAGVLIRRL